MKPLIFGLSAWLLAGAASAWSEQGHNLVALIAYDLLSGDEQQQLRELLTHHPRYDRDFGVPDGVSDPDRYRVGRAGYWPDVARSQPAYNRPEWHYQRGAALVLGDPAKVSVPEPPGPLPADATLATHELYIEQAITLCRSILGDASAPAADRALALCWLGHMVADAHQPCHAGALYAEVAFADGDSRAGEIGARQGGNLHAFWDDLLGRRYDESAIEQRRAALMGDDALSAERELALQQADDPASEWLAESRELARTAVYSPEVVRPIQAVIDGKAERLPRLDLSPEYLQAADKVAQVRAVQAGYRLAAVWRAELARAAASQPTGGD